VVVPSTPLPTPTKVVKSTKEQEMREAGREWGLEVDVLDRLQALEETTRSLRARVGELTANGEKLREQNDELKRVVWALDRRAKEKGNEVARLLARLSEVVEERKDGDGSVSAPPHTSGSSAVCEDRNGRAGVGGDGGFAGGVGGRFMARSHTVPNRIVFKGALAAHPPQLPAWALTDIKLERGEWRVVRSGIKFALVEFCSAEVAATALPKLKEYVAKLQPAVFLEFDDGRSGPFPNWRATNH